MNIKNTIFVFFLSVFSMYFISCGHYLNKKFPDDSSELAGAYGVSYTGDDATNNVTNNVNITVSSNGIYYFQHTTIDDEWVSNNSYINNSTASSTWKITTNNTSEIKIFYEVDSEENHDFFNLTIGNTNILSDVSGDVSSYIILRLFSGEHLITATYTKDGSYSYGNDKVKLKFVID